MKWWQSAVIYHIYPRSFRDTNGDGFGDLNGIIEKLPYIRDLGADAIWMGPIFTSPQVDNGYDVADYRHVDPRFGSDAELDRLIAEAHRRGIKVLLDLVFNHTSDQHRWFTASRRREAGFEDFYIWRDPVTRGAGGTDVPNNETDILAGDAALPNDWRSFFGGPAWTWDDERRQYYLHLFAPEQPDLNWENPEVRRGLQDIANGWIDRGIDGFRMDVINMISKAPGLPSIHGKNPRGVYIDGPALVPFLREFRAGLHRSDEIVLVGETPDIGAVTVQALTDPDQPALDMVLLFDHVNLDHGPGGRWDPATLDVPALARTLGEWQKRLDGRWPSIYMSNHDQPRIVSRYGNDTAYRYESATALATLFYLQRGTPIVYQGDEIGMRNYPITTPDDIADIESGNAYRELVASGSVDADEALRRVARNARDNGRTPMQWSAAPAAGFCDASATPWFPPNPDYTEWNVAAQDRSGGVAAGPNRSVLSYYRTLFSLRRWEESLREGAFAGLSADLPDGSGHPVVAYRRVGTDTYTDVFVNCGADPVALPSVRADDTVSNGSGTVILCNYSDASSADLDGSRVLRPWEAIAIRYRSVR